MKKARFFYSLFLLAAVPVIAWPQGQKPYPVVTEVKNGVKTVTNPDFPRDGCFVAKLTEEMSCDGEGGAEAGLLNKPRWLDVDGRGNVYVMDLGDVNIKIYDGGGRFLKVIGRKGQGPGEFGGLAFFKLMGGDRICVLDTIQHRIMIMSNDGRYLSGFPIDGFFNSLALDGSDRVFIGRWAAVKETDQLSTEFRDFPYVTTIFRTDASGKEMARLYDFLGESWAKKSGGGNSIVSVGGGYGIVWVVRRDGKICGGCQTDYSFDVIGENGKKEFSFDRRFTPVKNPDYGRPGQKKMLPVWSSIVVDEDGNLWTELYREKKDRGRLYDVFSPEGVFIKQVSIEQKIGVFKHGKVYSLLRPEDGFPSVKRYKMDLVPAGK